MGQSRSLPWTPLAPNAPLASLALLGLGFEFAWRYWFMGTLEAMSPLFMEWCPRPLTGVKGLCMLLLGVALLRAAHQSHSRMRRIDIAALLAMAVSSCLVASFSALPFGVLGVVLLLAGAGSAWLYLRWGLLYCALSTQAVFTSMFSACLLGTLLKCVLYSIPALAGSLIGVACIPCTFAALFAAQTQHGPNPSPVTYRPVGTSCILKISLAVLAFSVLEAVIPTILDVGVSSSSL